MSKHYAPKHLSKQKRSLKELLKTTFKRHKPKRDRKKDSIIREVVENKYLVSGLYIGTLFIIGICLLFYDILPVSAVTLNATKAVIEECKNYEEKGDTLENTKGRNFEFIEVTLTEELQVNTEMIVPTQKKDRVKEALLTEIAVEMEEKNVSSANIVEIDGKSYALPQVLYLHVNNDISQPISAVTERVSTEDFEVDLSNSFEERFIYNVTNSLERAISILTYAESRNQPFIGQICVAEDIRNSLFSGVYGSDLDATCKKQFFTSLQIDAKGYVHLIRNGVELTQRSDSTDAAAVIALRGSNITGILLEEITKIRNEQFPDWNLDSSYYSGGAYFHYAPALLDSKSLTVRAIGQVPVSFELFDHVFYGKWLNAKYALC